jgi:hypothetical protein
MENSNRYNEIEEARRNIAREMASIECEFLDEEGELCETNFITSPLTSSERNSITNARNDLEKHLDKLNKILSLIGSIV